MNKKPLGLYASNLIDDDWPEIGQVVLRPARRILSLLSLILMLAASGADMASKGQFAKGITISAESHAHFSRGGEYADSGMDELALDEFDQAAKLRKDLHLMWHRGDRLIQAGVVLFVLALGFFGLSRCIGERAFTVWFLVLSMAYILAFMMMV